MGCDQPKGRSNVTKYEIENEIRQWEQNSTEFGTKYFLDVVFDINTKIHLDGEEMTREKFENYFLRCYDKRTTQDFFENDMIRKEENKYDTLKIKSLLFLLTNSKRIETVKNCYFYDKANYLFSYVKDYDRDEYEFIDRSSKGLKIFLTDLVDFSLFLIPDLWLKFEKRGEQFEKNKFFTIRNKKISLIDEIINKIFNDEINLDKTKITLDSLNEMFDYNPAFLSSGYIREVLLDLYS